MVYKGLKMTEILSQLIDKFGKINILVIGDVMLDRFIYGAVDRISPESPVPVLRRGKSNMMPGGAGNVAANLAALGIETALISLAGKDESGEDLQKLLKAQGVETRGLIIDKTRPTTEKTRFVAGSQQIMRLDDEETCALSSESEKELIKQVEKAAKKADLIILSDYAKGVLTDKVIAAAMGTGKTVLVDPKAKDFSKYKGAFAVTPNRKELQDATGMPCKTDDEIGNAAHKIMGGLDFNALIVTRSEDGLSVFEKGKAPVHLPAQVRSVHDVSGAGDTVLATLGAAIAAGSSLADAGRLANIAAGIAVSRIGVSTISAQDLKRTCTGSRPGSTIAPRLDDQNASRQIREWQSAGLKVGFTNGCFDILHHGHVSYLDRARAKCDKLVLGLNHDASVKILKGPERPVNDQDARASVIGALGSVDLVVFFGAEKAGQDNTPCGILNILKPDIIFKGGDYTEDRLPEAKIVRAYGGDVEIMPLYEGYSTTGTIEKMKKDQAA